MAVSVKYGILCEDVRREDNGKLLAIGIYGSDIGVASLPATLQFAMLLAVDITDSGSASFELAAKLNDAQLTEATLRAHFSRSGTSLVPVHGMLFKDLKEEGDLTFLWRPRAGEEWKPFLSLQLSKRPIAGQAARA